MSTDTRTGGRPATQAVIGGGLAIAVGKPTAPTPDGFEWRPLNQLARLETGHTPSRRHPEYWDGEIPWIGIRDATGNHGRTITQTLQTVTQEGLDNSSARLLPAGTVCLSRTASVGFVVVTGVPMATSQDFVNWVCGPELDPRYLKYVLQADREALLRFANGSTHQTIYFPEVKAFHALLPPIEEQRAIAATLGALDGKIESNRRAASLLYGLATALYLQAIQSDAREATVGEVAEFMNRMRQPLSKGERAGRQGHYPYYGATGIVDYVDDYLFDGVVVLVGEDGTVIGEQGTPVTQYVWGRFWVNNHAHVLKGKDVSAELLILALAASDVRPLVTGAVQAKVSMSNLKALPLKFPTRNRQGALEARLSWLFAAQRQRTDENVYLQEMRDVLLPELLSGRIRVKDAEDFAAEEARATEDA